MKVEKFKVLLYLKKSGLDKNGKAPIMGRITLNRTMAQFVASLLGHKNITTTQVYAKVVNKEKERAVGLIDKNFK